MTQEKLPHRKELCLQSEGLVLYQTLSHTLKLAPHESPSSQPLTKNPQQLCYFLCKTLTKDPQQVWQTLNNFDYPFFNLI